eukprot:GHVQ01016470.1.p1 GENE.GHVQ01016470.1~~GHVQ01016470.1.p1  ORF type:complete len:264 (-),score=82.46 GHVQ01016470.1:241-1032(-)
MALSKIFGVNFGMVGGSSDGVCDCGINPICYVFNLTSCIELLKTGLYSMLISLASVALLVLFAPCIFRTLLSTYLSVLRLALRRKKHKTTVNVYGQSTGNGGGARLNVNRSVVQQTNGIGDIEKGVASSGSSTTSSTSGSSRCSSSNTSSSSSSISSISSISSSSGSSKCSMCSSSSGCSCVQPRQRETLHPKRKKQQQQQQQQDEEEEESDNSRHEQRRRRRSPSAQGRVERKQRHVAVKEHRREESNRQRHERSRHRRDVR